MSVAAGVAGAEAVCVDHQLAGDRGRSHGQGALVGAERATYGGQPPRRLRGEADVAALRVDLPDPVCHRDLFHVAAGATHAVTPDETFSAGGPLGVGAEPGSGVVST